MLLIKYYTALLCIFYLLCHVERWDASRIQSIDRIIIIQVLSSSKHVIISRVGA